MSTSKSLAALVFIVLLIRADVNGALDKANYVKPDVSGTVREVSNDGKLITLQTSKGTKEQAPTEVKIQTEGADVAFSAIGPLEDRVAEGYQAQIWLQPGSTDKAAKIRYAGTQSLKSLSRPADIQGTVASMTADGKRLLIESPSREKGVDPAQIEINLTPATDLLFNAVGPGGAKVQQDYEAQLWLDETRENAVIARLSARSAQIKKAAANPPDLAGEIVAVAPDAKSFTIKGSAKEKGVPAERKEVQLVEGTKVVYMGVPEHGTKPKEGYRAEVWLDGTTPKTIRINATPREKGPDIASPVLAVSPDGRSITVELRSRVKGEGPQRKDVNIGDAKLVFNNVRVGEAKPTVGYDAHIWLDPKAADSAVKVAFGSGK